MTDTAIAWDTYAGQRPERRPTNARGETTWFNWTQYEDHGPGAELLGLRGGGRVLDLGCGKGGNAAHLAALGMRAVGVDISPRQLAAARERWGQTPGLELLRAEAVRFLQEDLDGFDAVYSVYGAAWFTDPALLLPAIRERLRPGGRFIFPAAPGRGLLRLPGVVHSARLRRGPLVVKRWDYEPEVWKQLLDRYGYTDVRAQVLAAPPARARWAHSSSGPAPDS